MSGDQISTGKTTPSFWRFAIVPGTLIATVIVLVILGRMGVFGGMADLPERLAALGSSPWGLPVVIGVFCLGAYIGAPQFGLVAGCVLAFGPWMGGAYAWGATLCSGTLTFWTGRVAGEQMVRRFAGRRIERISEMLGRNAFLASALIRNLPTAPFIVVNMVFGASHARFLPFFAGLGLGSVPKIALIAFLGQSVAAALAGSIWLAAIMIVFVILLWFFGRVFARRYLAKERQDLPEE